jgi:hypothetical protein
MRPLSGGTVYASIFSGVGEKMSTMPAKSGGVAPVLLPAVGGMFVISVLDAAGMISTASPLALAVYYGLFGAGGGIVAYALVRRLRR